MADGTALAGERLVERMSLAGRKTDRLQARLIARGLFRESLYGCASAPAALLAAYDGAHGDAYWKDWCLTASSSDFEQVLALHLAAEADVSNLSYGDVSLGGGRSIRAAAVQRLTIFEARRLEIGNLLPKTDTIDLEEVCTQLSRAGRADLLPQMLSAWRAAGCPQREATPTTGSPDVSPAKRGPKGRLTEKAAAAMLADLQSGKISRTHPDEIGQDVLKMEYGVRSRDTAMKAWRLALSEFAGIPNSDS